MADNIQNPQASVRDDDQTLQLADLWALIWDNKWWYVLSVLLFLFIAGFHLYKTPNTYSRSEKVIVDEDSQATAMKELTAFAGYRRSYYSGNNVDNELEAFASPDLMQKVVARLGYETRYVEKQFLRTRELFTLTPVEMSLLGDNTSSAFSFLLSKVGDDEYVLSDFRVAADDLPGVRIQGHLGDSIVTPVGAIRITPTARIESWNRPITVSWVNSRSMGKAYAGRLSTSLSSKQSSVVVLTFTDVFPARSEAVLSTLLDIYNEEWVNNKNRSARNTADFINDRLVVIEKELGGVESSLKDYKQAHQLTNIQSVSNAYLQQSSEYSARAFEVNNQLSVARYIKDYLNNPVHSRDLIPANTGLQNSTVESQVKEYNETLLKRDRLLNESSENSPLVIDLNVTLEAIKVAVNRSIDNYISTLQLQMDKINDEERTIMRRIASTSGQELELLSIERQQKVKEQLYVFLLQKREENELQSLLTVSNTRLIQTPSGSSAPVAPNKMMILLIALVLGLGIPFALFYVMKVLDTSVKGRNDLSRITVPFLAEIPELQSGSGYLRKFRRNRFDGGNTKILVRSGSRDMVNEAFRVLRTNLDLMVGHEGSHTIMVTSFNPGAGKTFTMLNLAASVALKGSKVIILDLDLRKATLSKAVGKNNSGIASYLNGKTDSIEDHVQTLAENLFLLSVGSLPPNPAELLVSDRFKTMLSTLKGQYDYIFLDCPPVDLVADTSIIAAEADITIFIIRSGLFDKRGLPAVEQMYKDGRYNRMAIILNGVETYSKRGYGYGYGYG